MVRRSLIPGVMSSRNEVLFSLRQEEHPLESHLTQGRHACSLALDLPLSASPRGSEVPEGKDFVKFIFAFQPGSINAVWVEFSGANCPGFLINKMDVKF